MILMPLPAHGFDPTEAAVSWWYVRKAGYEVAFATPEGKPSHADERLLTGEGFGLLAPLLMAQRDAIVKYQAMVSDAAFLHPLAYDAVDPESIEGVLIPGGHDKGVKTLLESERMQQVMVAIFARDKPVGAVCHGAVLLARSRSRDTGRSVLYGPKTTSLSNLLELSAWWMTRWWLKDYYRTYPMTVEDEVIASLADPKDYQHGPILPLRDTQSTPQRGFVVRDGNYISARWPGDCHHFAQAFVALLAEQKVAK